MQHRQHFLICCANENTFLTRAVDAEKENVLLPWPTSSKGQSATFVTWLLPSELSTGELDPPQLTESSQYVQPERRSHEATF